MPTDATPQNRIGPDNAGSADRGGRRRALLGAPRGLAAWTAVAGTWLVVVLIFLPPWIGLGPRAVIMSAFSSVCHQIPSRSAHIDGVPLAVCHRCLGIFVGLAIATAIFMFLVGLHRRLTRHARVVLVLALLPVALDWGLDAAGLWANTPPSRAFTGAVFGLSMGALLVSALSTSTGVGAPEQPGDSEATRPESRRRD